MNLSVEHVLMFVLVFCAFYYMMNRCGCKEGMGKIDNRPEDWMLDLLKLQQTYIATLIELYDPHNPDAAVNYYDEKNMRSLANQIYNTILLLKGEGERPLL
jgi:hypothetical protein